MPFAQSLTIYYRQFNGNPNIDVPGQCGDLPPLLHTEPAGSIAASQRSKALVGNAGCPGYKLKKPMGR